jgi:hypothetical protein
LGKNEDKRPCTHVVVARKLSRPPTRAKLNMTETLALEPAQGPSAAPRVTVGFDLGTASLKAEVYCPSLQLYTTVDNWPSEKRHNDYGRGIMPQAKTLSLYFEKPDPSSDADHFFGSSPRGPGLRGLKLSLDNSQIEHWGQQQIAREFREECESHGLKPDTLFTELLVTATKTIRDFLAERGWVWATTGLTVSSIFTRPDTVSRKIQALYRSAAEKAGMPNVQIESEGECDAQWLLRTHPFQPPRTEPSTLLLLVVNVGGMTTVSTSLCGASIYKLTDVA